MAKSALIVEDSKIIALAIKKALQTTHYSEFEIVDRGDAALTKYKAINPDIVTMDINMSGLDGFEASQQILEYDPDAKIIVITEVQMDEQQRIKLGTVCEVVLKPVTVAKLQAAISRV